MSQNGGIEPDMSDIMDCLRKKARDHSRTPMQVNPSPKLHRLFCLYQAFLQWNHSPFAGFIAEHTPGSTNPWMRVNDDYSLGWNVAAQRLDQTSVLNFWRTCVRIRKELAVTLVSRFYVYSRTSEGADRHLGLWRFHAS